MANQKAQWFITVSDCIADSQYLKYIFQPIAVRTVIGTKHGKNNQPVKNIFIEFHCPADEKQVTQIVGSICQKKWALSVKPVDSEEGLLRFMRNTCTDGFVE